MIPPNMHEISAYIAVKAPFEVTPMPYAYNALKPVIEERTMQLHHKKHFTTYIGRLNDALQKLPNITSIRSFCTLAKLLFTLKVIFKDDATRNAL